MLNVEFDDRALFYFFSNFDLFCKFYLYNKLKYL